MPTITKKQREIIKQKYEGRCAYSGTVLEDDWQVDHIKPIIRFGEKELFPGDHSMINMIPCQKIINHYKGSLPLEEFRTWFLDGLHTRLKKLPKNPKTEKSKKKIIYLRKVASYFGITEDIPFSGKFYFETLK